MVKLISSKRIFSNLRIFVVYLAILSLFCILPTIVSIFTPSDTEVTFD